MRRILILYALLAAMPLSAQNDVASVLGMIERNNTTLDALRKESEAQKLTNRTGLFLENPEVEFNYLWGSPSAIGNRKDFSVSQTFDFPSAYGHRNSISRKRNDQVELEYRANRMNILLEAELYCVDLFYYDAMKRNLEARVRNVEALAGVYRDRLESGDGNIMDSNKAQLNLVSMRNELARIDVEREAVLGELRRLNGGADIYPDGNGYSADLPPSFDEWIQDAQQKSPVLQYVGKEVEISRSQVKLNRSMSLPKFSAGYMSEKVVGEQYQGIKLSMSVPLWENRNTVRSARAEVMAAQGREEDARVQFYQKLENLYAKASGLRASLAEYDRSLKEFDSSALYEKALQVGEISLLEYFVEMELYYGMLNSSLSVERDYRRACAELSSVTL